MCRTRTAGCPTMSGTSLPKSPALLVASEAMFRDWFAIEVRTQCEAVQISPETKTIELRHVATGEVTTEAYDKLVLSPGAASVRPPLPGIDLPGIFHARTVPDARAIREWADQRLGHGNPDGRNDLRPHQRRDQRVVPQRWPAIQRADCALLSA